MPDNSLETTNNIEDLALLISELQKDLQEEIKNREIVEVECYNLKKEILELQRAVKDKQILKIELDKALNKSKANCMTLSLEIKRAVQKFWMIKNG